MVNSALLIVLLLWSVCMAVVFFCSFQHVLELLISTLSQFLFTNTWGHIYFICLKI